MYRFSMLTRFVRRCLLAGALCLLPAVAQADPVADLLAQIPRSPADLSEQQTEDLVAAARTVERAAAAVPFHQQTASQILTNLRRIIAAKQRIDQALEDLFALRTRFADLPAGDQRRQQLRLYLRSTSALLELSGQLRFLLRESIDLAAYYLDAQPTEFQALLDLLSEKRLSVGAELMAYMLFDPPPGSGGKPYSRNEKYQALNLIGLTHHADMVAIVAEFVRQEKDPQLVVIAVELLRRLGVPQAPRPERDPALPPPPTDAQELYDVLAKVRDAGLPANLADLRREQMAWLQARQQRGVLDETFRLGSTELRPGDWLLMRNPSPYNQFTDISPGLFTHVGVVAVETGSDGIRRFVVVDLPERGDRIPATTVDSFLMRTLSYVFLRHRDPEVGRKMGQAAADLIGNESQFDLNFDTSRVLALRDVPLADAKIHTYCAGLLLVCALQTGAPREAFFPIAESCPGGNTADNLARLGLSIGDDFISPTGALFSPQLEIVARREPMYDPGREVQETIYDYFAECMMRKSLSPSPTLLQATRESLAVIARDIPWLAKALAEANDVSQEMDLVAAARTAGVVETLDEIAEESLNGFAEAQASVTAGEMSGENARQYQPEQIQRIGSYQQRHADLFRRWQAGQVTPRQLRMELVRFYADRGKQQLDDRFFPQTERPAGEADR
jgi:hypothetical protein